MLCTLFGKYIKLGKCRHWSHGTKLHLTFRAKNQGSSQIRMYLEKADGAYSYWHSSSKWPFLELFFINKSDDVVFLKWKRFYKYTWNVVTRKTNTACEIYISHDQMHINIKCEHRMCQLHRKDGLEMYAGISLWSCT